MKRSITLIANKTASMRGRFILFLYKTYTALFIKQTGFPLPYEPVSQREIILVRKTGRTHRAMVDAVMINLS